MVFMEFVEISEDPDYCLHPIDVVRHGLKDLACEPVGSLSARELAHRSILLQQSRQQLDGLIAATISEAEAAGSPTISQQRTMAQVVAADTHANPDTLRADIRAGRFLRTMPVLEQAVLDGHMSRDHVLFLSKGQNTRVHSAMARDQHLFVQWARDFEWKDFKSTFSYWLAVNDEDGPEPEDDNALNTVTIRTTPDGRVKGSFDLDGATGGILKQQLGDEANAVFNEDEECGHPRTTGQRRAQALANLIRRGAGRSAANAKPLVHVVMSLKVLMHAIDQLAKDEADQDFTSVLDFDDIDGRCELIDGTPVNPKFALVLAMQAYLRRQVLGAKGVTLEASYETRGFPEWMRHIKLVEARGSCTTAGCDAQHTWLHADHRTPHSKDGLTELENLDPLCRPDNLNKSNGPPLRKRGDDNPCL